MALIALTGVAGYLMYFLGRSDTVDVRSGTLKYSGIDPEEYRMFIKEMERFEDVLVADPRQAATHLYKGLDHFSSLSTHNQYDVEDEIDEIVAKIGMDMERRILDQSLVREINFTPRYLNNRLI